MTTRALSFDDITLPLLNDCLATRGFPELADFSLADVPEPGQAAAMTFIDLEFKGTGNDAPKRLIAKQRSTFPDAAEFVELLGGGRRETMFYSNIANECPLDIPACYHADYDAATGKFLLILEDRSGPPEGDWITANVEQAGALVAGIQPLHTAWWQHDELADMDWTACFDGRKDGTLGIMQSVFQGCADSFIETFKDDLTDSYAQMVSAAAQKPELLQAFDRTTNTLVHGDYHYKNAFFPPGAAPIVFDWQVTGYGTPAIDISRTLVFLRGPVDQTTDAILAKYHAEITNQGIVDYSRAQLTEEMCLGYIYNLWLTVAALMETDIQIIRDIFAARNTAVVEVIGGMDDRMAHAGVADFIAAH